MAILLRDEGGKSGGWTEAGGGKKDGENRRRGDGVKSFQDSNGLR
jgi:hypothetical protein